MKAPITSGREVSKQNKARMIRWAIKKSILSTNPAKRFRLDAEGVDANREPVAYGAAV